MKGGHLSRDRWTALSGPLSWMKRLQEGPPGGCQSRTRARRERLVLYCRTTSTSTAPFTSRRMCCPTRRASNCDPERTQGFAADPDYWQGEVFVYVGLPQNLKDLKGPKPKRCQQLLRAFSGWIRSPPPTGKTAMDRGSPHHLSTIPIQGYLAHQK